jgi:hypothetical protein
MAHVESQALAAQDLPSAEPQERSFEVRAVVDRFELCTPFPLTLTEALMLSPAAFQSR